MQVEQKCLICKKNAEVKKLSSLVDYDINCGRCGIYIISRELFDDLTISPQSVGIDSTEKRSVISHALSKNDKYVKLTKKVIADILTHYSLPKLPDMVNSLVVFLGDNILNPSDYKTVEINSGNIIDDSNINLYATIGLNILTAPDDFKYIIDALYNNDILYKSSALVAPKVYELKLTFEGWQKYEELKLSTKDSRKAFMAMKFYNESDRETDYYFQEELLPNYLKKAVANTGFKLENPLLDPKMGNIHSRLEVEIRNSKFLVADLTHHNNGAYWEAGFARGLGKPVIYMCQDIVWNDNRHFDVGSDTTIKWSKNNPQDAAEQLKSIIRNTFPSDAKMEDTE